MPIYEYVCKQCSSEFELLVLGDDSPSCPDCSSAELGKLISVPSAPSQGGADLQPGICGTPMPGGGCALPQCGQGPCGMN